ncbi:MAG: PQQ-dependent sugar dehydrogenase, partial [Patescibacteria group bacterium]
MKKKNIISLTILLIIAGVLTYFYFILSNEENIRSKTESVIDRVVEELTDEKQNFEQIEIFAENLDVPWSIVFLPNGDLLVTERKGTVRLVSKDGEVQESVVATISDVRQVGEGGLHGITIHPDFEENNYVYLYFTYGEEDGN